MGCIYQIAFPNGKRYIGMTVADPNKRLWEHRYQAAKGMNLPLYRAMRSFGIKEAKFDLLVIGRGRDYLANLERAAIHVFNTKAPHGYNLTDGGDGAPVGNTYNLGKKRTAESRRKMSISALGKTLSNVTRAKIGAASRGHQYLRGRTIPPETRAKMSIAHKGKVFTIEHRANIARAALARRSPK